MKKVILSIALLVGIALSSSSQPTIPTVVKQFKVTIAGVTYNVSLVRVKFNSIKVSDFPSIVPDNVGEAVLTGCKDKLPANINITANCVKDNKDYPLSVQTFISCSDCENPLVKDDSELIAIIVPVSSPMAMINK